MKIKAISIILTIMCLFTACGGNDKKIDKEEVATQISRPFSSGAHIVYQELEAFAQLSNDEENGFEIIFTSPETLKDIKFTLIGEKIKVAYKDINFTIDRKTMVGDAVSSMILKAINSVTQENGIEVSVDGSALIIKGEIENGIFYLSIDSKTGNFLKLEIPEKQFLMEFSNFTIKK
ncbi:MAG: hypothetical protein RR710_06870 [Oscillospiraceae bacterium]